MDLIGVCHNSTRLGRNMKRKGENKKKREGKKKKNTLNKPLLLCEQSVALWMEDGDNID